jgi:hypothetical protein
MQAPEPLSNALQDLALEHPLNILVHFQGRPERLFQVGFVTEGQQRLGPDDRLSDPGLLIEVALFTQTGHGGDDPGGDPFGHLRQP